MNEIISYKEHFALLIITFLLCAYFPSFFAMDIVREYNLTVSDRQHSLKNQAEQKQDIKFAVHDFVPRAPAAFHLTSLFILISLIKPRKFVVSTVFTIIYFALLVFSLFIRMDDESPYGVEYPPEIGFFDELYRKTWIWDYAGALYILIALPWQIFILQRTLR